MHGMSDAPSAAVGKDDGPDSDAIISIPDYDFDMQPERIPWTPDFKNILFRYIDGQARSQDIYLSTPECVVIYDAYPKARVHLLVIPRRTFLASNGIDDLCPDDLSKVEQMHRLADRIASSPAMAAALSSSSRSSSSSSSSSSSVRTGMRLLQGYHANPSLRPLHLHLVSDDFRSDCIKTKKHWLSFTTDFFVAPSQVEALLRDRDRAAAPSVPLGDKALGTEEDREAHLNGPLRCHVCATQLKNMPALKAHLLTHCT